MITKVKALFYRDVRYVIPSYQRAYSWEGQQHEQFIEDLRDVSDKYYLGHFLFEKTKNGSVLCLIDGQQRLTTIVIFFSCLRHAFSKRFSTDGDTKKICDYIDRRYLRDQDTEQPHLATVENDNVFFIHEIIDRDSFDEMIDTSSKKRITSNPQPIGFSGILLAKRQNSFYCTYFLHNRNVADTKSPYPIKRLEVIRWFNQKSMVFNQSCLILK